jgi:hypothetical protein
MKWLLLLLLPVGVMAKDFTVLWDPSGTAGVFYRVWLDGAVARTTTTTSAIISINPGTYSIFVTAVSTNAESDPSNVFIVPPPASVPAGVAIGTNSPFQTIRFEAEASTIVAPMGAVQIAGATGSAVRTATANAGTAGFATVLSDGQYVVWARMIAAAGSQDSFFVSVDGTAEDVFGNEAVISPNWQWLRVTGGNGGPVRIFALPSGSHTFTFRGREVGVPLDAIYVTSDLNFTPQ